MPTYLVGGLLVGAYLEEVSSFHEAVAEENLVEVDQVEDHAGEDLAVDPSWGVDAHRQQLSNIHIQYSSNGQERILLTIGCNSCY